MKLNVLFLGVLKYKNKNTGEPMLRITYLSNDTNSKQETMNFKGLNECAYYTDRVDIFDKFTKEDALSSMEFTLESRPSMSNPLKSITQVIEIKTKRDIIKLV